MTLYAGQSEYSVTPLESEKGKLLFDEKTRAEAYDALKNNTLNNELKEKLEKMYTDGSYQAGYFIGTMIAKGVLKYPVSETPPARGDAGPGFGKLELGPYISARVVEVEIGHQNPTKNPQSLDESMEYLRDRGIDPYSAIENE